MHWDIDPLLIQLGPVPLRWYGLFFAFGLLIAVNMLGRSFRDRNLPERDANSLSLWLPVGMILGAHLIHLIFYEPRSFIDNPIRIIEIGEGLASHGGGLGVAAALWLFCRKHKVSFLKYADATMVAAVWLFPWVRVGNLFNSEIYGRETDLPWGVVFVRRGFTEARHPSQVYEALFGFALIGVAVWLHRRRTRMPYGVTLFVLLLCYFTFRFFIEYVKEYQILARELPLTMGQCLSLPVILLCIGMLYHLRKAPLAVFDAPQTPATKGSSTSASAKRRPNKPKKKSKRKR